MSVAVGTAHPRSVPGDALLMNGVDDRGRGDSAGGGDPRQRPIGPTRELTVEEFAFDLQANKKRRPPSNHH